MLKPLPIIKVLDDIARQYAGIGPTSVHEKVWEQFEARFDKEFGRALAVCESPIEQIMLARLAGPRGDIDGRPAKIHIWGDPIRGIANYPYIVIPQFPVDGARFDFLVRFKTRRRKYYFDIECDGAEHHSSIEDRHRDGLRDDHFKALGFRIFRFLGQSIWSDNFRPEVGIGLHVASIEQAEDDLQERRDRERKARLETGEV